MTNTASLGETLARNSDEKNYTEFLLFAFFLDKSIKYLRAAEAKSDAGSEIETERLAVYSRMENTLNTWLPRLKSMQLNPRFNSTAGAQIVHRATLEQEEQAQRERALREKQEQAEQAMRRRRAASVAAGALTLGAAGAAAAYENSPDYEDDALPYYPNQPAVNIDGSPMINGVDANGNPFGVVQVDYQSHNFHDFGGGFGGGFGNDF